MAKLMIIRGLPSSGKTTMARLLLKSLIDNGEKAMIVCRDDLRFQAGFGKWAGDYESTISMQQTALIRDGLKKGFTVISADTNLNAKSVKGLAKHAEFYGAEVEVVDMDTDVEECVARDNKREGREHVGEDVIRKMHRRYFRKGNFPPNPLSKPIKAVTLEPYERDTSLPKAYVVDIDGTVANHEGNRSPYDYTKVSGDTPHEDVIELVNNLSNLDYKIIFLSGREDSCKRETLNWLSEYTDLYVSDLDTEVASPLYMRKAGDDRADFIIKYELFMEHIAPYYNVVGVLDDRDQVVQNCWRAIGVRCYQVADGDF